MTLTLRRFCVCSIIIFTLGFLALQMTSHDGHDLFGNSLFPDFAQFYVYGKLARTGSWSQLYAQHDFFRQVNAVLHESRQEGYYSLYPPFVSFACVPWSYLPYSWSAWLFTLLNIALAIWLAKNIANLFLSSPQDRAFAVWIFCASIPVWRNWLFGQNGLISLALAWMFYQCYQQRRFLLSGAVLSLGLYKPHLFWGLWLWLFLWGPRRAWLGWVAGVASLVALPACIAGPGIWRNWIEGLQAVHTVSDASAWMHSLHHLFVFWLGQHHRFPVIEKCVWAVAAIAWLLVLVRLRIQNNRNSSPMALALLGSFVLSVRVIQYDLVLLYPVLVAGWASSVPSSSLRKWLTFTIAAFWLNELLCLVRIPLLTLTGIGWFTWTLSEALRQSPKCPDSARSTHCPQ